MSKTRIKTLTASTLCAVTGLSMIPTTVHAYSYYTDSQYVDAFMKLRDNIHNPYNGYFREFGNLKVPYYSPETFIIEGPDYGHEATSDVYSDYLNLEAMYGKFTGDWNEFQNACNSMEKFAIPNEKDQGEYLADYYSANNRSLFYNDYSDLNKYPSSLMDNGYGSFDPLGDELKKSYGTSIIYGMHNLSDVDNWYGFGVRGNSKDFSAPSYIRTFDRGPFESVFDTIPHPAYDSKEFGNENGFSDLFISDEGHLGACKYSYTVDSSADASAIQAIYYADKWSSEQGKSPYISKYISNASKMGDYLRYSFCDKFFRPIGIGGNSISNEQGLHYLLSNGYTWSCSFLNDIPGRNFRYGNSNITSGNQNPMTAWILSENSKFAPLSPNGSSDWAKSLDRQIEFYQWIQTSEGPLAPGATNSYTTESGSYKDYPEGTSTFYGLAYDTPHILDHRDDPHYFLNQVKSIKNLADYYYQSGDTRAKSVLDKWFDWTMKNISCSENEFKVPKALEYMGEPDTWDGLPTGNPNLHAKLMVMDSDIGTGAAIVNASLKYFLGCYKYTDTYNRYYARQALDLLDVIYRNYEDDKGFSSEESSYEYSKIFDNELSIPENWTGTLPNGYELKKGSTFLDARLKYKNDPDFPRVNAAYKAGIYPVFKYHRFSDQVELAEAFGNVVITSYEIGIVPPPPPPPPADVNSDGKITIKDYIYLQKYILSPSSIKINKSAADLNGDGKINIVDLMRLKKFLMS